MIVTISHNFDGNDRLLLLLERFHSARWVARQPGQLPRDDLLKCESAVAGLRKTYLPREWESRCSICGLRHSAVEKGTCKFWIAWAAEAKAKAQAKAKAPVDAPAPASAPAPAPAVAETASAKDVLQEAVAQEEAEEAEEPTFTPFMPQLRKHAIDVN